MVSHAVAGVLHVQIVLSHWSMHSYEGRAYTGPDDEWYITTMRTTMNVATHPLLDWMHIGLQFQVAPPPLPRPARPPRSPPFPSSAPVPAPMSFRRQPRPASSLSQPRAASSLTTPTPPPQVEHHLFPRLPRHNLRIARDMVKEVVEKHFPAGSPECKRLFPLGVAYHEPGFFEARSRPARGAPCRAHAPRPPLPSPRPLPASTAQRNRPLPFPATRHRARSHVHSHAACAVVAGQPRDVAHAQAGGVRGARRQEGRARLLGVGHLGGHELRGVRAAPSAREREAVARSE